jgi:acetyl-CoA carboxylase/biotin carboxylase 1
MLDRDFEHNDREVAMWYEENKKTVHNRVEAMKTEGVAAEVAQLLMSNKDGGLKGVQQVLSMLPVEEREVVLKFLAKP